MTAVLHEVTAVSHEVVVVVLVSAVLHEGAGSAADRASSAIIFERRNTKRHISLV